MKSVLLASPKNAEICDQETRASGAEVLYRGENGLLLTDAPTSALKLSSCEAMPLSNDELDTPKATPPASGEKNLDLPTLLRLIPAEEIGARSFVKSNPTADGRGVVVAVLDTGVEIDHPMLKVTSDGKPKVVDFKDFSGEGLVTLAPMPLEGGAFTVNGQKYTVEKTTAAEVNFGVYAGSSLKYSEDVASIDTYEDLGVISYKNEAGELRGKIDTNNDKSFDDEKELFDFKSQREFVKIGKKKTLTTTLDLQNNGLTASLSFDDGSHGTHVAGIATGYNAEGLQGVAPGAQVIAAKIGDNRLSGGSTTTASMLLAIDFAVKSGAHVINLSYGIRSGANIGKSAIDQYVDKVAREKGTLFSISAGNEGPGLLTIGTPAAADLAITNGAYVSAATARDNYGYVGVQDNGTWFFSSVGPRLDGGWKPTLLSPGSALSSVPKWSTMHANYRGTSMASPQTTGGLALVLSAAMQGGLLQDRVSVTRAVYESAKPVSGLSLVEQGHGLMDVNSALATLAKMKAPPIEYDINVTSPTSPTGRGKGIYVRARSLPTNGFNVSVTPIAPASGEALPLRTLTLKGSAEWIQTPGTLWIEGTARTFQVTIDPSRMAMAGLHSEVLRAYDDKDGSIVFEVPVTLVIGNELADTNQQSVSFEEEIRVGKTERKFIEVPAGTTSLQVSLTSGGPALWAQLLDPEGKKLAELRDAEATAPLPPLYAQTEITRPGVYELDIVAPATNLRTTRYSATVKAHSLVVSVEPAEVTGKYEILIQNHFAPVKLVPKLVLDRVVKKRSIAITGNLIDLPIAIDESAKTLFEKIDFRVQTSKKLYDLMTDYPFRVFDAKKALLLSGGLEPDSSFELPLEDIEAGEVSLQIQGAFTKDPPASWSVDLTEARVLKAAKELKTGARVLVETGQSVPVAVDLTSVQAPLAESFENCPTLNLETPTGQLVQRALLCELLD